MKTYINTAMISLSVTLIIGAEVDSTFSVKWTDLPWGSGGLHPDGPPWSMVGPYDFDNDGFGDFIVTSSYTGTFCNGVYHFEATDDDTIALQWYYYFGDLSCAYDNYSSVTVGDVDGDSIPEILVLADTEPGTPGGHGLQIFEWNADSLLFPYMPTTTWDMGLDSVWEAGQIVAAELDGDANQEVIVSIMNGPWGTTGSSHFMIFELENNDLDSASWNIEYTDPITTNWSGYNIYVNDLDQDGLMEIYTIAYEYYRLIIYENIGSEDLYAYQTDFYVSNEVNERGNQSIVMGNFDGNNTNELYAVTSGTNSLTGELLTPGYFYAIEGSDNVSQLTFSNFHYFNHYQGGLRQINTGDADMDGKPNLYLAGHYNEAVYDWEFIGDNPLSDSSFVEHIIFMDDTTDDFTSGTDQGKVRVAKLFAGDIDNDNHGDIVFTSAGLGSDKPHIYFLEHDGSSELATDYVQAIIPKSSSLDQNYPNPFNPQTQFHYSLSNTENIYLAIYDLLGREVFTIHNGLQREGNHNVQWTGVDNTGNLVPSGIYFCRLTSERDILTKKMVLNR
jgi:hypothetical protein